MPNKKKQRNGFYFFMKYLQNRYAAEGKHYTMSTLPSIAHPLWKELSAEEREKYDMQARTFKMYERPSVRCASDGTPVQQLFDEEAENIEKENEMRHGINELLSVVPETPERFQKVISVKNFYILSFNILCCTDDKEYIPLEVGVAKYSISDGIINSYHKFIHPGPIPTGYAGEAKRHSDDTHQIPITGHDESEKDYALIVEELADFLNPQFGGDRSFPPVFCLKKDIPQILGSVMWLSKKSGNISFFEDLKVWDIAYLFLKIREGIGKDYRLLSYYVAEEMLTKNTFDYTCNTRCSYHDDLDIASCALGYSKRLCYLLSDSLCEGFDVVATAAHLPLADEVKPYEYHLPTHSNMHADQWPHVFSKPQTSRMHCPAVYSASNLINETSVPEIQGAPQIVSPVSSRSRQADVCERQPNTPSLAQMLSSSFLKTVAAAAPGTGIGRGVVKKT